MRWHDRDKQRSRSASGELRSELFARFHCLDRYHCPEVGGFVSTAKPKEVVDRATENGWMSISGHESFDAESTWALIRAVDDEGYADAVCTRTQGT